jgi:hypothetical protein
MPAPAIRAIPKVAPAAARTPARSGSDLLSALDDDEGAEEQPTTIAGGGALAAAFGALVTAPKD